MRSCRFNGDSISIGRGVALIKKGQQRFVLEKLTAAEAIQLQHLANGDLISPPGKLFDLLKAKALIDEKSDPVVLSSGLKLHMLRMLEILLRVLTPLSAPWVMTVAMAITITALALGNIPFATIRVFRNFVENGSFGLFLSAYAIFLALAVVHEIGHLAAYYRATGIVGTLRLTTYRGMPVLAAEVSALSVLDSKSKASIALAGPALQMMLSAASLLTLPSFLHAGIAMSLFAAATALIPFPRSDGYWFLRDRFGLTLDPNRNSQSKLRDRLANSIYRFWLCAAVPILAVAVFTSALQLAGLILRTNRSAIETVALFVVPLYMVTVMVIYVSRTVSSIMGDKFDDEK